jgi:hypothetical protein
MLVGPASAAAAGSIAGEVTDASTEEPIAGITACAFDAASTTEAVPAACGLTGGDGKYAIELDLGSYWVNFSEVGLPSKYVVQWYDGTPDGTPFAEQAEPIPVTEGEPTSGIDAQLQEGAGSIEGEAIDSATEDPISGVLVCPYEAGNELAGFLGCWSTGVDGRYRVFGLHEGEYKVAFFDAEGVREPDDRYALRYYGGVTFIGSAQPVPVSEGVATEEIDAQLQEGAGFIEGEITDSASEDPLRGILVCPYKADSRFMGYLGCVRTRSNGKYTFPSLPPDEYKVEFFDLEGGYARQYYNGADTFEHAQGIPLAAGETRAAVDAEMQEAGAISGAVLDEEGGEPIEWLVVCARASNGQQFEEPVGCSSSDESGEYAIAGLAAGAYKVQFTNQVCPPGEGCHQSSYIPEYYDDVSGWGEAGEVVVSEGVTTEPIDAELALGGAISGTVTDEEGEPIEWLLVCAHPAGGGEGGICANTDESGEYTILGLPTGNYRVDFSNQSCPPGEGCVLVPYIPQSTDVVGLEQGEERSGINAELEKGVTIEGEVTDAGEPSIKPEGICIAIHGPGGEEVEYARTGSDGRYAAIVPPGEYKVQFVDCRPNPIYLEQWWNGRLDFGSADVVDATGGDAGGIDAALVEGNMISGKVTSDGVNGILGICISVRGASDEEEFYGRGFTDEEGEWAATVPAGEYKVGFEDCDEPPSFRRWWNERSDFSSADVVDASGGDVGGIDAVLPAPTNTGAPSLSGNPAVGVKLSCSEGSWSSSSTPPEYAFAWLRDGSPIAGGTSDEYTVQSADRGHGISCKVTASNLGGSTSETSEVLQVPSPEPEPEPSPAPAPAPAPSPARAPPPPAPPAGAPGVGAPAPAANVAKVKGGKALLRLSCRGVAACRGLVKLVVRVKGKRSAKRTESVVVGKSRFSIPAGKSKTLHVKLTGKGKKLLRQAGKRGLKAKLTGSGVKPRTVKLKPAGGRR